jgi:hypothetical protein
MWGVGPQVGNRNLVPRCRSAIPRGGALNCPHNHYAEPVLPRSFLSPGFEILYLAENPMVAMFEARVLFGSPSTPGGVVPHPARPMVVLPVTVDLEAVADLTEDAEANVVSTTAQELTGDWRSYADRTGDAGGWRSRAALWQRPNANNSAPNCFVWAPIRG